MLCAPPSMPVVHTSVRSTTAAADTAAGELVAEARPPPTSSAARAITSARVVRFGWLTGSWIVEARARLGEDSRPAGVEHLSVDERLAPRRADRELGLLDSGGRADPGALGVEPERRRGLEDDAEPDQDRLRRE